MRERIEREKARKLFEQICDKMDIIEKKAIKEKWSKQKLELAINHIISKQKTSKLSKRQMKLINPKYRKNSTNLFTDPKVISLNNSNQNLKLKINKKKYLDSKNIIYRYDEIDYVYMYLKKLESKGIKKIIKNAKDAELEWINFLFSQKNIQRTESLTEARKKLECIKYKEELSKLMNKKYSEIDKMFSCDEIQAEIQIQKVKNLGQRDFSIEIEDKLERASRNLTESNP